MARLAGPRKGIQFFRITVVCAAIGAMGVAQAAPLTLSGGVTSRYSDNATRAPGNEISDSETRVNLTLAHRTDPGKCEARTAADIGYGVWEKDTFEPRNYVGLDFAGDCELARGLSWEVSDNLRDVTQNPRVSDTPDNRTRKNVFRTGPVYSLMVGQLDQLTFSAQYENTEYSEPEDTDSERYIGTASWNRTFNETLSGGLRFSTNRAELDSGAEINTDVASIIFVKSWQATQFSGSIGVSELESEFRGNTQVSEAVVWDVSLDREVNPVTDFYIRASRELTDQSSDFDIRFGEVVFNLREISEIEVTAVDSGLVRQFSDASQVTVGVFANRADYIRTDEVEERVGFLISYNRPVATRLSLQTQARYQYRTFAADNLNDNTYSANIGLSYELTQDLDVKGRVGHAGRDSDLGSSDYQENWVSLALDYQFF